MTLIIERLNGKTYNLEELGIRVVEFEPESPNIRNEVVELDGGGVVVQERGYGSRYLNATFRINNYNLSDYAAKRTELFSLFSTTERFYIIDTKEIFKRWLVRVDGNFSLNRDIKNGDFSISFVCVRLFAESVRTSLELEDSQQGQNLKQWDINVWTWNSGIDWDTEYRYRHNSNSFTITNIGSANIDPSSWDLEITIKATASSFLELINQTTSETYRYNGNLGTNDTLVIRGVRTFKNGVSAFANTNYKLISLISGNNQFLVNGGTIQSIVFEFRYPYK